MGIVNEIPSEKKFFEGLDKLILNHGLKQNSKFMEAYDKIKLKFPDPPGWYLLGKSKDMKHKFVVHISL